MKNEVTVIHTEYEDGPKAVATVDVGDLSGMGALEYAFRATTNWGNIWSKEEPYHANGDPNSDYNPDVTVLVDVEGEDEMLRSTVVGYELLYEGKRYRVDEYGFKLVTETSY